MLRILFQLLFLLIILAKVNGQHLYYKLIGNEQGLPSSSVYALYQDRKGYLWIGTEGGGLSQYSGDKLKTYNLRQGLKGINVRAINEDSRGNIIFGNSTGLHRFNGRQFRTVSLSNFNPDVAISNIICFHNSKTIWVSTAGSGLYILKETESGYSEIKHIYNDAKSSENFILDMDSDAAGNIWTVHYDGFIQVFNPQGQLLRKHLFKDRNLLSVYIDNTNHLLYVGTGTGAYKINFDHKANINEQKEIETLVGEKIFDICGAKNRILFATEKKGVLYVSDLENYFLNTQNGLPVNFVYKLLQDANDNFWLGTINGGLVSYQGSAFSYFTKQDGIKNQNIFNIEKHHNNNTYYLASYGSGILSLQFDNHIFKTDSLKINLPDAYINDLTFDADNNLWFATKNGAGYWNGNETKIVTTQNGLLSNNVNCILADSKKRYWFGTSGGINLLENGELNELTTENGLPDNEVQALFEDSKGHIWIGTLSGLARYDGTNLTTFDEKDGLLDKTVYAITEDGFGQIWIGTFGGGIYRCNNSNKTVSLKKILTDDDILSNNIYSLGYNKHTRQIITGTDKGASAISLSPSGKEITSIKNFSKNNGFISQETNLNAIYVDNNNIFFGTNAGLTCINLKKLNTNNAEIPLHITDLHLFYKPFLIDTGVTRFHIPDKLEFPPIKNHLTFYFEGVSFTNTESIKYSFILEGLDSAWSPPSENKFITYSSLSPGIYTFKIRIKGADGTWQKNIQKVSFIIHPPFYKTWWFIFSAILATLLSIFLFIRWRESNLKKENMRLEKIIAERTSEVVFQKNEAEKQKELVEEKQKEILDSISYAKRLQNAVMAPVTAVKQHLPDSFIFYKPKDIVAGDFYCFEQKDEYILIAAADCTGHGVPGALVSIVCSNAISSVLKEISMSSTGEILNKVRDLVLETFSKSESEVKDGMDISMACINTKTNEIYWSGANNPIWIIMNDELHEIKANKQPIGLSDNPLPFTTHHIRLSKGDTFYLFTDGYADQFGGPKGKKFKYRTMQELLFHNRNLAMAEQESLLKKTFEEWKGDLEQVDDICVIGVRI